MEVNYLVSTVGSEHKRVESLNETDVYLKV
jgi:hypothetical protein